MTTQPLTLRRLLRDPFATSQSLESAALVVGAFVFVLAGIVALIAFWGRDLPLSGPGSLGQFIAIGSAIVALVIFVIGRWMLRRSTHAPSGLHWYDDIAIAIAHALIALIGWTGFAAVMSESFVDATVYAFSAAAIAAVGIALTAYAAFLSAVRLSPMLLSAVLAVFLVCGAIASMLSASDPHWWKLNLSALGMTSDISSLTFNITLIVAGVIVTAIANYAAAALPASTQVERRRRSTVRTELDLLGILLACVGIFPVNKFLTLHNMSAVGMLIVFAVLILSIRRTVPNVPRVFALLGYVYLGVIFVVAVFFVTGYYNLTAVELIAAVLVFSWLILFLRNTSQPADASENRLPTSDESVAMTR
jgi:hypothetical membrane protein